MKKLLLILFVVVLLVSGCGEKEAPAEESTVRVTGPDVKTTELPAEKIPGREVEEVTGPALTSELKAVIAKADKVESAEYSLAVFIISEPGYYAHVYEKGNRMKQEIEFGSKTFTKGTRYDTAYFDLSKKTVEAYCEEENCEDRNALIDVDYDDFITDTPFTLLDGLTYGENIGTAMIEGLETIIVSYETQGNEARIWLWEYRGLPVKYELRDGETLLKKIEFKNLVVNDVDDEDLVHSTLVNED